MTFDLVSVLAPTVTDADARAAFLADPHAVLAAAGFNVPEWMELAVTEGTAPALSITLPPMLSEGELSEAHLDNVAGGLCILCTNYNP